MKYLPALLFPAAFTASAGADVIAASPDHYTLRHEALSPLAPGAMWNRLVHPETWWSAAHTYSGDAANLSLDLHAGGLWKEEWEGG